MKLKKQKLKNELITKVDDALQKKADQSIQDFERNQHLRLKFLCNPGKDQSEGETESDATTLEEKYSADARKFRD